MHEFVTTEDGSLTLRVPELDEHYHSVHGAIQEARHIFLRAGIDHYRGRLQQNHAEPLPLHILEAGFGTGLNAYLTLLHAEEIQVPVCYHSLEKYPLPPEETARLNYPALLGRPQDPLFRALHDAPWEETVEVTPRFLLHKHFCDFREIDFPLRHYLFRCLQPRSPTAPLDTGGLCPLPPCPPPRWHPCDLLRQGHRQTRPPLRRLHPRTPTRSPRQARNAPRHKEMPGDKYTRMTATPAVLL